MIDKIKNELRKRLESSAEGMIEIEMRKSGDVVIIYASGPADDENTVYKIKSFKLQPVYAKGLTHLAKEIAAYDTTVTQQQELIELLYEFKREKIDTGLATMLEKQQYTETFNRLFGYRPSIAA